MKMAKVEKVEDGYVYLSHPDRTGQGFENITDYPFVVGQIVETDGGELGSTLTQVRVDGRLVVEIPLAYQEAKRKLYQAKSKVKAWEDYLKAKPGLHARIYALPPRLRDRLVGFIEEYGQDEFFTEAMGGFYELFISEQAAMLVREFSLYDARAAVAAATGEPVGTPAEALDDWWELNSQKHDYNYTEQHRLVPEWSSGHSGMTGSAAYYFARSILEDQDA
jgi:hypothetical protein